MPQKSKEETHLTIPGLQTITVGRLQNLKQPGTHTHRQEQLERNAGTFPHLLSLSITQFRTA